MITIENLAKSYGKHQILKNIHITLEKGKIYGIVGENGAGKTTLFKCIAGLEDFEGNIESAFKPLKNYIGYLQTESYFFSKMTGKEYIHLLCHARNIQTPDFEKRNVFDLPLNQYVTSYSTGMKKKLAFTAILMQDNEVFILDEPFNGVDIQSNMMIVEIIKKLKMLGKTVLVSSHIFSTLHEICDEIHLLREGTFVKKALPEEFKNLENEMRDFTVGNLLERLDLK
ncbi:MAG: ATP-binding cassette domain-containing protein [Raineya sp.]|jgi:ABC-2 type transport system ATP-binding protein|nr:ATP-binding cassette domain-containing protein [Raineya sp.]